MIDLKKVLSSARVSVVSEAFSAGGWTLLRWTKQITRTTRTGERVSNYEAFFILARESKEACRFRLL